MWQQMIDRFIEEDLSLSARRTADTRRYIVSRWNVEHDTPMDEDAVMLFLCDETGDRSPTSREPSPGSAGQKCLPAAGPW